MDLVDIPAQVARAFKYSLRSWSSFLVSLISGFFLLGICFDLLYGFLYTRIFNEKEPLYGPPFWFGLMVVAVAVPVIFALLNLVDAFRKARPFKKGKFGIAIAPFDVCSLDPDTLGTSAKLQALDVVTKQFFSVVQRIISEEDWSKDFEFRFLPANVQIHRKKDAIARAKSLGATMLIWGTILQHSNRPINMTMCVLGPDLDMKIDGSLDFFFVPFFKLWALNSAASCLEAKNDYAKAKEMYISARGPAREVDAAQREMQGDKRIDYIATVEKRFNEADEKLKVSQRAGNS